MATRKQNEGRFKRWKDLANGGREYWKDRPGEISGFQRIIKIVDEHETTQLILQEVYDDDNILIQRHQKFPMDTGHQYLDSEE